MKTESGSTILVVDDNRLNRNLLASILKSEGYKVETRRNGVEAIEAIERNRDYSALIFDLKMPVFNGIQLVTYLALGLPHLLERVIVITAFPDMAARLEKPVFAFLRQPVQRDELILTVALCVKEQALVKN